MSKQKLPKWFEGTLYDKGDKVVNSFSGESYELNAMELSMYDFILLKLQILFILFKNFF